jgi:hypothetical protein
MIDFSELTSFDFYFDNSVKTFGDLDTVVTVYFLVSALVTSTVYFLVDIRKKKYFYRYFIEYTGWLLAFLVIVNLFGLFLQLAMFEGVVEFGLSMRIWTIVTVLGQLTLLGYLGFYKIPATKKEFKELKKSNAS